MTFDSNFWIEVIGYGGTAATAAAYGMRTIIPLRVAAILSSAFFIIYAILIQALPMLVTEFIILPLNVVRLFQALNLTREIEKATARDVDGETFSWLEPYGRMRHYKAGEVIFRAGDEADYLLLIHSGKFRLLEAAMDLDGPKMVGELGFLSPGRTRTMTLECVADGSAARVSYSDIKQLYFQNPKFGFFLLHLISERLFENIERAKKSSVAQPIVLPA